MKAQSIGHGYAAPTLAGDDDTILDLGTAPRTGGLNLTGVGRSLTINGGDLGNMRLNAVGKFDVLRLAHIKGDFRNAPSDGFDLGCSAHRIEIDGCRLAGISGQHSGFHGDGIQIQLGANGQPDPHIDLLVISNTTILTGYQGLMAWAKPDGSGVKVLVLNRVNFRDEPTLRHEPSFAMYLGDRAPDGNKTAPYTIILGDVWVDEAMKEKALFTPVGATVIGAPRIGIPPGGDFCPPF